MLRFRYRKLKKRTLARKQLIDYELHIKSNPLRRNIGIIESYQGFI